MKITIINKRASTGAAVYAIDSTQVAPGTSHAMTGRTSAELFFEITEVQDADVAVVGELEGMDRSPLVCTMKTVGDPGSGVNTSDEEGFDILTQAGSAANVNPNMYIGVFDDATCQTPAVHATLSAATTTPVGTVVSGSGTHLMLVTPASTGAMEVKITDTTDEKVYLKAWPAVTSYVIDCSSTTDCTFSA